MITKGLSVGQFKDIEYELIFAKRKTLAITIYRDKKIIVRAPQKENAKSIEVWIEKKYSWIIKKLQHFDKIGLAAPKLRYLPQEIHLFLGGKYELKIEKNLSNKVFLEHNFIIIKTKNLHSYYVKKLLYLWYKKQAIKVFDEVIEQHYQHFTKKKPVLKIRKMKRRWGSMSRSGKMTLNLELIRAPIDYIEDVVLHELCHIIHHDHSKNFYQLLEKFSPNWRFYKNNIHKIL